MKPTRPLSARKHVDPLSKLRKTAPHLPIPQRNNRYADRGFTAHFWIRDVSSQVIQTFKPKRQGLYAANISGNPQHAQVVQTMLGRFLFRPNEHAYTLIPEVIRRIASHIMPDAHAHYEIVHKEGIPHLCDFPNAGAFSLFGYWCQVIPRQEWEYWGKKGAILPAASVWCIDIPQALGGRAKHRATMSELRKLHFAKQKALTIEDYRVRRRTLQDIKELSFQATRHWGWIEMNTLGGEVNAYFTAHNRLRFEWALAVLREHIIQSLNDLVHRLNFDVEIQVQGFRKPDDYMAIIDQMRTRKVSTDQAMNVIYGYD